MKDYLISPHFVCEGAAFKTSDTLGCKLHCSQPVSFSVRSAIRNEKSDQLCRYFYSLHRLKVAPPVMTIQIRRKFLGAARGYR